MLYDPAIFHPMAGYQYQSHTNGGMLGRSIGIAERQAHSRTARADREELLWLVHILIHQGHRLDFVYPCQPLQFCDRERARVVIDKAVRSRVIGRVDVDHFYLFGIGIHKVFENIQVIPLD